MTLSKDVVDGFLVAWDEGEYQAQVKSMRQTSQAIKPVVPLLKASGGKSRMVQSTAQRAQAVRDRLSRTVRKVPEVMVKITSACKGMTQIGRHIDYISRKGEIDMEDQDGLILRGKDRLKDLKAEWRSGGPEEISPTSQRRDTLNIVFSMPAHTDEVSMKRAVRAFAVAEFKGHQYVFAYHTQATDPDPDPPAHPHVHLSVKTQGWSGRRLNPRKADLQRWREDFAAQLRAHGIEANATSRLARLNLDRGKKRSVVALLDKDQVLHSVGQTEPSSAAESRGLELQEKRRAYYGLIGQVLGQSEIQGDRQLATEMSQHFALGPEPRNSSRGQNQDPIERWESAFCIFTVR